MLFRIRKHGNLFSLEIGTNPSTNSYCATVTHNDYNAIKWHHRLSHVNYRYLETMQTNDMVIGLPSVQPPSSLCVACTLGKQHYQSTLQALITRASEPLALVHTDLYRPMKTKSIGVAFYFLIFIEDFTRYAHIYFLQKKSAVITYFTRYKNLVENHTSRNILILRSDNGGEFTSIDFNKMCSHSGIQRHFTNSYNPSQNGVSERKNRTLVESACSMLHTAQLPNLYWAKQFSLLVTCKTAHILLLWILFPCSNYGEA